MLTPQRHQRIIEMLAQKQFMNLEQLVDALEVSPATVRRDLNALQKQNLVKRTHGGVMFLGRAPRNTLPLFMDRQSVLAPEKTAIGRCAAQLVDDGDTVIIDGGTTTYQVALQLKQKSIQIVTNSLPVANFFADSHQVQLISTGGTLYPGTGVYLGPFAEAMLKNVHAQKAFIGVAGLTEQGLFNSNALVTETEKQMIQAAAETYVVTDHTKFNRSGLAFLCDFTPITAIVTNDTTALSPPTQHALQQAHVNLITA